MTRFITTVDYRTDDFGGITMLYEVKLLTERSELLEAYSLVYDNYVETGYISSNPLGLRIREEFELGWNINTFGGFRDGELVGVLSVIKDSDIGLPSDKTHDLREFRVLGGGLCEVSNLVIKRGEDLFLQMICYIREWAFGMGIKMAWVVVSPSHVHYFTKRLGFIKIGDEYRYENGDIVQGMLLTMEQWVLL